MVIGVFVTIQSGGHLDVMGPVRDRSSEQGVSRLGERQVVDLYTCKHFFLSIHHCSCWVHVVGAAL